MIILPISPSFFKNHLTAYQILECGLHLDGKRYKTHFLSGAASLAQSAPTDQIERTAVKNQSEAARILEISRVTVWKQIREYGIQVKHRADLSGKAL
jgi:transcriptional regulator of acetoin/glycerol metabolism